MSFRSRLLICTIGIVIACTAVSLFIAQQQNQRSYRTVVDEMFRREAASFRREQEKSLSAASIQATRLASSVRLFAALEAEDESVYQVASDEMRMGDFSFFRLATASGEVLSPPPTSSDLGEAQSAALVRQLSPLPATSTADTPTSIGFVSLPVEGGEELYRVLLSPIFNFEQHMGWLVMGQQFTLAEADAFLQTGIHVGGRLFSRTLPAQMELPFIQDGQEAVVVSRDRIVSSVVLNAGSLLPLARLVSSYSLQEFHAQQKLLAWRIAGVGALAVFLASVIAYGFARQLAEPIKRMVIATQKVRAGEFAISLPSVRTAELNELASSLNEMAAGLVLKEKYHSVLQMVADPQVADELMQDGLRLGGEMREVSILFCDVRGYTALSADMDPVKVIALLNDHMSAMTRIVHARRGVVKQFTGDGIMILFGAPRSYGRDVEDAVHCAMEMMRERQHLNVGSAHPMRIGIGVATGAVVAGGLGAENRAEYSVVGERVNLAARLCGAAAADEVLIDESTHLALSPDTPRREAVAALVLKGYSLPVAAWRLLLHSSTP
jgi:class 3 adenylate cyclase